MPQRDGIEQGLVDDLLALQTREQQTELLRKAGLLDAAGLSKLLDTAEWLLNGDPGKAQRLAELCSDLADSAGSPVAVPRASYIRAGAHNLNGAFDADLELITAAHDGYADLGMTLEALRTNVGKMDTLLQLGRYEEALDTGRVVLEALGNGGDPSMRPTRREHDSLAALVHQNLGGCFYQTGRYGEALEAYVLAEERYRSLGMTKSLGEVIDNQGVVFRHLGRSSEALEAHKVAARIFHETGLTLSRALSLGNMGETYLQLSDYTRSLDAFERARRLLSALDAPVDKHIVLLDTANVYLALNLYPEALAAYTEANEWLEGSGIKFEHARGLWGMGSALIACSRFEEAEKALERAAELFADVDNTPFLSDVMLEQASLLAASGNRIGGLARARQALEILSEDAWPVQKIYARLRLADLLRPETDAAEWHLIAAQRLVKRLALPHLHYRLNERMGHLRLWQGRDEEARALLEAAVDEIDRLRGTVAQDAMRASFLRDKTAAYEDLLLLHVSREGESSTRSAFAVAERAKSRSLVDLLIGVSEREPSETDDQGNEARILTLQADLNVTYNELLGGASHEEQHLLRLPSLHARAAKLEQEISRLRLQAAAVGSTQGPFERPVPANGVLAQFPSDVTLLAYHVVGDEILVFVHARGRTRVLRNLSTLGRVNTLLHKLRVQWDRFRAGRGFAAQHMKLLERSTRQVLSLIYSELVAPLESILEEVSASGKGNDPVPKLAVVPHGPLHQVPFHALFDGGEYLLERFEISYAPSATVYALCQERSPSGPARAVIFGVEDPVIPAAVAEAYAVAEHVAHAAVVRVGEQATVAAFHDEASGCDVLHLACHGLFRADNPMFSSLKMCDGWITAADALDLDLTGALVTLSACESGRSEVVGGDEVLGLTRAFLGAGAATLVVSLWLAQDETTAALMEDWYGHMGEGMERAASLRAAQLAAKERHPHPYYWAPFVLIGKR